MTRTPSFKFLVKSKQYLLIQLVLMLMPFIGQSQPVPARGIKNGYAGELNQWNHQVKGIRLALQSTKINSNQRPMLKKVLKYTKMYRDELRENFDKTEKLLSELKYYDPNLFETVNGIRDREGNQTNVYVKVIDNYGDKDGVYGSTNLNQSTSNEHVYSSCHGDYSVLVKVASGPRALTLLVHEFGHVLYQVPNLASYVEYYNQVYKKDGYKTKAQGHHPSDPSNLGR